MLPSGWRYSNRGKILPESGLPSGPLSISPPSRASSRPSPFASARANHCFFALSRMIAETGVKW